MPIAWCRPWYRKLFKNKVIADSKTVIQGIDLALYNQAKELYLMDSSLNARPKLSPLLENISALNVSKKNYPLSVNSGQNPLRITWPANMPLTDSANLRAKKISQEIRL